MTFRAKRNLRVGNMIGSKQQILIVIMSYVNFFFTCSAVFVVTKVPKLGVVPNSMTSIYATACFSKYSPER